MRMKWMAAVWVILMLTGCLQSTVWAGAVGQENGNLTGVETETVETEMDGDGQQSDPAADSQQSENSEKDENDETGGNEQTTEGEVRLKIEDANVYEGMTKAYKDGYEPVVENGKVKIVIPVIAGDADVKEITVTPNLGDTSSSPFVYSNYQKTFAETEEFINNTNETKKVFLVSYTMPLNAERTNGVYPVVFDMTAKTAGMMAVQSFTVYVRITDGDEPDDGMGDVAVSSGGEETPTSEPKLILAKCTADTKRIEAGSEFGLMVEIKNTSRIKYVQNMTIEVTCPDAGLTLLEDSHTFYFERLGSEEILELPLRMKAGANMAEGRYDVQLAMSYDNPDAVSLASSGTVSVDIHQPLRVELEAAEFPQSINAGDTLTLSIQAMNLGRGKVYNVRCTIDAPGLSAGTSAFLGNLEAGSAVSGELKIFAGMKDKNVYGTAYGFTSGRLVLEYEDEDGSTYEEEMEISTTVNPLAIAPVVDEEPEQAGSSIATQWKIGVAVGLAVLVLSGGIIIYKKKKGGL